MGFEILWLEKYETIQTRKENDLIYNKTIYTKKCDNLAFIILQGFGRHMKGKKHLSRMENLGSAHNQASEQEASRLKAQEHLRSVEKKPR